jgi:hypothetical protein
MGRLPDGRDTRYITYEAAHLLWVGILIFCLKLSARRGIGRELATPRAVENLGRLCGQRVAQAAHPDTLANYLTRLPAGALEGLRDDMIQRLIRMKALDGHRLFGALLVAVDATGQLSFGGRRHCQYCLSKKSGEQVIYYHPVLEAKLVTSSGLAFSLATEFIENSEPHPSKQDCELKAFARLAVRIKGTHPQLRLCFLFDGLYARGSVFDLCRHNGWDYIVSFKEGSMPALWREYQNAKYQQRENHCQQVLWPVGKTSSVQQDFAWASGLVHVDDQGRRHSLNAFECREQSNGRSTTFAWLTNMCLRHDRQVMALANGGGRCRWKIENEGFNTQKNGGYALEHAYSTDMHAWKHWYLLLQIAHLLMQLLERGNLLGDVRKVYGSLKALARRLAESLRCELIEPWADGSAPCPRMQIRLNSS